jgi:putative addiction module killer protein
VYELRQTDGFDKWLSRLRDPRAKARILARLDLMRLGHLGDARSVGDGVSELRVDVGPGYRVYFARRSMQIIALCGGDKSTQDRDILRARLIARSLA